MRLTTVLLIATMMQVSAASFAQKISLKEKNAPLEKIFNQIRLQSGYDFLFNRNLIKNAKPVNIHVKDVSLEEALEECFAAQPFTYTLQEKTIVIKEKEPSFLDRLADRWAAIDISGYIYDEEGNPLPGASVKVKNGKQTTITDQYGHFFLKGVDENVLIMISYIGYSSIEIRSNVFGKGGRISLNRSDSKLDEVQVMAYGITSRRTSTGNISTIKAEDIEKQPVTNPLLALQGRVAGLVITPSSGLPGSPVTVEIRGVNTLGRLNGPSGPRKTASPLFIIDGVPFANNISSINGAGPVNNQISAFSFINPADIESIDVLKDADATAIYGSRGANGVILITTKKGKLGTSNIELNVSSGYGEVPKFLSLLNTHQYLEMRKEAFKNDGRALPTVPSVGNYDLTVYDQNRYTDWQKRLIGGTAQYTKAQGTISGGSANVQYLISGDYNKQGYVFPGDAGNTSGSGHFSISGNSLNNKFKATLSGSYMANNSKTATDFTSGAMTLAPNAPELYTADGSLNWQPSPNSGIGTWTNPYASLLIGTTAKTKVVQSSANLGYQILPSLTIKTDVGFSDVRANSFTPRPTTSIDPYNVQQGFETSLSSFGNISSRSWNLDPQILYHTNIGRGRLDAVAGASLQGQTEEFQTVAGLNYTSDALLGNLASAGSYAAQNTSSQYKSEAVFGRLTYNWADRYLLNVVARRDGSSRFGPGRQFGNFGSAGAAWIFTNEDFIKKAMPVMSFGKLRFSYGTSGNDGIGDYEYLQLFDYPENSPTYQGGKVLVSSGVNNPDYHWETTTKAEIGLETGFFSDRILLEASYFRNRSSDQLGNFPLPATAGNSSSFVVNRSGKIQSSGWEFSLNTRNIKGKDFSWSSSANLSLPRNKLLALPADGINAYGLHTSTKIGDPYHGVVYVRDFHGVDPATGRYQLGDFGAEVVTTTPKFYGGISNTFSYKGFSLYVFLHFTKQMGKNYLYDGTFRYPGFFFSGVGNVPTEVLARWRSMGDIADIQRFTTGSSGGAPVVNSYNNAARSTSAYVDVSFIRVKNVALSYTIPQIWKDKLGIKNLQVYLQGQNLWTITRYKGLDPETQTSGRLPQLRVLTAGIQAGF